MIVEDRRNPSTRGLGTRWVHTDEWYAFRASPRPRARVLLRVDESTYDPGDSAMGADHPIAWCRRVGRGRSWYTAIGHTRETYAHAEVPPPPARRDPAGRGTGAGRLLAAAAQPMSARCSSVRTARRLRSFARS